MKSVTKMRSRTRERTGVTKIGQKYDGMNGTEIFATGRMDANFHWLDATEVDNDKFIILAIIAAKYGTPTRKNNTGLLYRPDAVCLKVSSILNIRQLVLRNWYHWRW
jgi:hypothetical protein